jgi:hypothetical protein
VGEKQIEEATENRYTASRISSFNMDAETDVDALHARSAGYVEN